MSYMDIPEPSLDPPEDGRRVYADCFFCTEPIHEYDDCYEFPGDICACMRCAERAHRIEVVLD